ncbi:hypothetical protein DYB25_006040 [Aphanomyces astaci]|uniref:Uncharacterized protein n=1 Tax=Aphanomyces astaci TaxID=112090 RepID=A0A397C8M3_APHAT|nr:hypothetical protein DYB25_006040 [Aphanomyces astaci]RHY38044.1 hypothetical protein DYB38_012543 [Aphanomyces astaci]RHY72565.1 hypothetical protein DYB30_009816 [Aphanomyces astaci]RHY79663.1 hypothetical protein DYB31_010289 [Aphanomyces astaci]
MGAPLHPVLSKRKRRLSMDMQQEAFDNLKDHPLYERISHVKTKRLKDLGYMTHLISDLQRHLVQLKRRQTSQLSWEDVTQALKDDTVDRVRDNRSLKQEVELNSQICTYLQTWLAHMSANYVEEHWRHSALFKGDEHVRHVGLSWITRQAYHNTDRVLSAIPFPSALSADYADYVDVRTSSVNGMLILIQVATQRILPYSLEDVSEAYWHAEKSFGEYVLRHEFVHPRLMASINGDIDYTHEEVGNHIQRISDKVLMGRFCDDHRAICVLRSVMNDEMYPLEANTWTTDTRQWMLAERLGPAQTRVRQYYSIDHPCTERGYVPLWEYARMCGVTHAIDDADVLEKLQLNRQAKHLCSRAQFARHFDDTLRATADVKNDHVFNYT